MTLSTFFSSYGMDSDPGQYLFKTQHFIYMFACLIAFFVLMKIFLHTKPLTRKWFINILLAIMLLLKYGGEVIFVSEWIRFSEPISSFSHPFWDIRTFISFQVCGINNILLPLAIWFNWKKAKNFVYTSSIIGGLAVLIYPAGVLYGDPLVLAFPMIRSLIVHFLLVFIPCFLIASNEFMLKRENWKYTFIGVILVIAWSMFGNLVIDPTANNLYLMENPFLGGPIPILNIIPNGYHVLLLLFLVFLGMLLVYAVSDTFNRYRVKHPYYEKRALSS